jgi:radical SAM protein with 4Fe4S-binding SPASM domain
MVPFLSADRDLLADPSRLARAGIFGCEGGQALASVRVDGKVAPCSFTLPTRLMVDQLLRGHRHDADLARWRRDEARSSEPCTSCPIADVCKGGCQAVSTFVLGDHGPDPECPRVVDHRLAEGARPLAEA